MDHFFVPYFLTSSFTRTSSSFVQGRRSSLEPTGGEEAEEPPGPPAADIAAPMAAAYPGCIPICAAYAAFMPYGNGYPPGLPKDCMNIAGPPPAPAEPGGCMDASCAGVMRCSGGRGSGMTLTTEGSAAAAAAPSDDTTGAGELAVLPPPPCVASADISNMSPRAYSRARQWSASHGSEERRSTHARSGGARFE